MIVTIDFDGGGSHKGSPAGWGWAAGLHGQEIAWGSGGLPPGTTNNEAEYTGLIMAATYASSHDWGFEIASFYIEGDSQLVVNQVKGDFAVKSPHLLPYRERARTALSVLPHTLTWHKRRNGSRADALATQGRENYYKMLTNTEQRTKVWSRRHPS